MGDIKLDAFDGEFRAKVGPLDITVSSHRSHERESLASIRAKRDKLLEELNRLQEDINHLEGSDG